MFQARPTIICFLPRYHYLGRYQEAIASNKEAIRIKPDEAKAHYNLGLAYLKLDQYQEAIASYKEAIRIKPNHVKTHNTLEKHTKSRAVIWKG